MRLFLIIFLLKLPVYKLSGQIHFRAQCLYKDNNEACAIGDINRDGRMDIVAGRSWFANPDFIARPVRHLEMHGPDYARNNGEHLIDMNGDGWLDVLTTGWGENRLRYFANPGQEGLVKGLPWKEVILADVGHGDGETSTLIDLDADGISELVINSYVKTKPFSFWSFESDSVRQHFIGAYSSHGIGFGDINGDNRMDILIDRGWYEQPKSGNSEPWPFHPDWRRRDGSCPMIITDLNQDGRNDIIAGAGHHYGLYWYEQLSPIADSTLWQAHTIDTVWSQVHTLLWEDLDDDGKAELITGKRYKAHSGKDPGTDDTLELYLYQWNGKDFHKERIATGVSTGLIIRVADLNQDGKKDLVMAGKAGTYILWQE